MSIPFNKPYLTGKETHYIYQAVQSGKISGDGLFTKKCHRFFEEKYQFKKCLLTTSCTDALEMAAILIDIKAGDEVIMPSYTFVSTANAFVLRGAKIIFADSNVQNPNIDATKIEALITNRTKAIVLVHYAGISCDFSEILTISEKYNLFVIEDAAQAIDSFYLDKPLGSIGHLAAFSFHETKNVICGEGGMLVINDDRFVERAEIIREKGTNRSKFFRGEIDKYSWVDIGSSFLPSDIVAAFLFAQLEELDIIQNHRKKLWERYDGNLKGNKFKTPQIPEYATNNAHMYYILCKNLEERDGLITKLKENGIMATFHYLSLHKSEYYQTQANGINLPESDKYADTLIRLPLFYELTFSEIDKITNIINNFFTQL